MSMIKSQDLTTGDIIDLEPVVDEFELADQLDSDIHIYEYAFVEDISFEDGEVYVITDQFNFTVPVDYLFDTV